MTRSEYIRKLNFKERLRESAKIYVERQLLNMMWTDRQVWDYATNFSDFHFFHETYQTLFLLSAAFFSENSKMEKSKFFNFLSDDYLIIEASKILNQQPNLSPKFCVNHLMSGYLFKKRPWKLKIVGNEK